MIQSGRARFQTARMADFFWDLIVSQSYDITWSFLSNGGYEISWEYRE